MKRNNALDGLRAWAICSVFMVHFNPALANVNLSHSIFSDYFSKVINFIFIGPFGVDIFFMLSGFLMTGVLVSKRFTISGFFISRLKRLFPAHFFVLAMQLTSCTLITGVLNLFFVAYFFENIPLLNFVEWSLAYEFLFYLFVACLILATRSMTKIFFVSVTLLSCIVFVSFWFENIDGIVFHQFRIPMLRLAPFLLGVLLFCFDGSRPIKSIVKIINGLSPTYPFLIMLLANFSGKQININLKITSYLLMLLFAFCLIFSMTNSRLVITRVFSYPKLTSLGKISYSFYLAHSLWAIPIALNIVKPFGFLHGYPQYYLVSMLVSILIASYMYKYLERPYFSNSAVSS